MDNFMSIIADLSDTVNTLYDDMRDMRQDHKIEVDRLNDDLKLAKKERDNLLDDQIMTLGNNICPYHSSGAACIWSFVATSCKEFACQASVESIKCRNKRK